MPLLFTSFTTTSQFGQTTYGGVSGEASCGAEGFGRFHTDGHLDVYCFSSTKSFAKMISGLAARMIFAAAFLANMLITVKESQ